MGANAILWGWDGTNPVRLGVEADATPNLRVRLYAGPDALTVKQSGTGWGDADKALSVINFPAFYNVTTSGYDKNWGISDGDGRTLNSQEFKFAALLGWNGASWDRLRVDANKQLITTRGKAGSTTVRKTGTGQVVSGAKALYWMHVNSSAANAVLDLTDAISGGGTVVLDSFYTNRQSHHMNFDPPMEFATGIYLETFTNITSVVFCYK